MKCPNCNYEIKDSDIAKHFASIGGKAITKTKDKSWRSQRASNAAKSRWKRYQEKKQGQIE